MVFILIFPNPELQIFFLGLLVKRFHSLVFPSACTSAELKFAQEDPEQDHKVLCGHLQDLHVQARRPEPTGRSLPTSTPPINGLPGDVPKLAK